MSTTSTNLLFAPIKLGRLSLNHRIVLAPLTRYRSTTKKHVPIVELMEKYYSQRASAPGTLLITEATFIAERAGGYDSIPGIWSEEQIDAWRRITNAVHEKKSFIYLQLWALGRAANPSTLAETGHTLVSASDIPITPGEGPNPRPLTKEEIKEYVGLYAQAAENAIKAGFDGVEIHGANGYLIDQFIQDISNKRTDEYGGSIENRSRFALEVVQAVVDRVGADRTGIRLSPFSDFGGMKMSDPIPQFTHIITSLASSHPSLSYIHLVEPRASGDGDNQSPDHHAESLDFAREIWTKTSGAFLSAGGYTPELALEHMKGEGRERELIVFGRRFLANPDLVKRIEKGLPLNPYNRKTFYKAESAEGYIDYPFFDESKL